MTDRRELSERKRVLRDANKADRRAARWDSCFWVWPFGHRWIHNKRCEPHVCAVCGAVGGECF